MNKQRTAYRPLNAPRRQGAPPATFLQRFGSILLDGVVAFFAVPFPIEVFLFVTGRVETICTTADGSEHCLSDPNDRMLSRVLFWSLASIYIVAFSWFVSRRRTFGQRAVGARVVDAETEESIPLGRSLIRTLAMVVSALPLGIGFWWALLDRRGRTWHDLIARTRVIST